MWVKFTNSQFENFWLEIPCKLPDKLLYYTWVTYYHSYSILTKCLTWRALTSSFSTFSSFSVHSAVSVSLAWKGRRIQREVKYSVEVIREVLFSYCSRYCSYFLPYLLHTAGGGLLAREKKDNYKVVNLSFEYLYHTCIRPTCWQKHFRRRITSFLFVFKCFTIYILLSTVFGFIFCVLIRQYLYYPGIIQLFLLKLAYPFAVL